MNAERLLKHYETVAEAPGAIVRLRRFVLDLAVRGRLVPPDPNDEPASELLKRVAKEKTRLLGTGEFREPSSFIRIERDTLPFTPPTYWGWARLIDIARPSYGYAFPSGQFNSLKKGMPLIRIRDISKSDAEVYFEGSYDPIYLVKAGDYLVGMDGDFNLRRWAGVDGLLNQRVMRINNWRSNVVPEFVRLPLQYILDHLHGETSLTTVKHLSAKQVNGIEIPLPPLAEQQRIVTKVDELMTLCDQLEAARSAREATLARLTNASLERLNVADPETFREDARFALGALQKLTARPDQIKSLRQTIVNLAVSGKLVPQDVTDEPASKLLKRIALERTGAQPVKKVRRNGEVEISGLRADTPLPVGWIWTDIDGIALSMRYGTSTKCEYAASGVPVLRIPNVSGGVISLNDMKFGPLTEREARDLALKAGDLLLIRSNGSLDIVGRAAVVTPEADGMAFAGYLVRLRLSSTNTVPKYIWLASNSTHVREQIEKPIRSAVGLKNVNLTEFGALTFPLPPLEEQERIVAKVEELMELCDGLEASLYNTDGTRQRLLTALLDEALAPATTSKF